MSSRKNKSREGEKEEGDFSVSATIAVDHKRKELPMGTNRTNAIILRTIKPLLDAVFGTYSATSSTRVTPSTT